MKVRDFVTENFNEEQQKVFDFIVSSFPEKLRSIKINGYYSDNEDVLAVLALLSKVIGDSRNAIKRLKYSKDLMYLYDIVDDDALTDVNIDSLILLLAEDLHASILNSDLSVSKKKELIRNNEDYFTKAYSLLKNRGTLASLKHSLNAYPYLNSYTITSLPDSDEYGPGKRIVVDVDNSSDLANTSDYLGDHAIFLGESGEYYGVKKDSLLYKMVLSTKPAGFAYVLALVYDSGILQNISNPVFLGTYTNGFDTLSTSIDTEVSPIISSTTIKSYSTTSGYFSYEITLENPYNHTFVQANIRDSASSLSPSKTTLDYRTITLGPGEIVTKTLSSFNSYDPSPSPTDPNQAYIHVYISKDGQDTAFVNSSLVMPEEEEEPTVQLEKAVIDLEKGVAWYGGYVELGIYNPNAVNVTAEVGYEWELEDGTTKSSGSRTTTVGSESYKTLLFDNPHYERINFVVEGSGGLGIVLSKDGYVDSERAQSYIIGVEPKAFLSDTTEDPTLVKE